MHPPVVGRQGVQEVDVEEVRDSIASRRPDLWPRAMDTVSRFDGSVAGRFLQVHREEDDLAVVLSCCVHTTLTVREMTPETVEGFRAVSSPSR